MHTHRPALMRMHCPPRLPASLSSPWRPHGLLVPLRPSALARPREAPPLRYLAREVADSVPVCKSGTKVSCNPSWSLMLIPITVHVPADRVPEFYIRFGEFNVNTSRADDLPSPLWLKSETYGPTWVESDSAAQIASGFWNEVSGPGQSVLLFMSRETDESPRQFHPDELAREIGHPKGASGIAGILGGVGKAIRRAGLPMYLTPRGNSWHYIWDWDGKVYTMSPEVARLLRRAHTSHGPNTGER